MGREIKESQNIGSRFSRNSAIERAKTPLGETVSDEEVSWVKYRSPEVPGRND